MGKAKRLRKQREEESSRYPVGALSYELKLARAGRHLQAAENLIGKWTDGAQKTVVEEADPEVPGAYGTWVTPPIFPGSEVTLLVGDCLQCFRTALDHLAFELASISGIPFTDDLQTASEFPIFGSGNGGLPKRAARKIEAIDPAARSIIEGLQPNHRGKAFGEDPLWRLHELNRLDKHRLLHVIAAVSEGMTWTPSEAVNIAEMKGPGYITPLDASLDEGRVQVARWTLQPIPIVPGREMRVNFFPTIHVRFDSATPLVGGAAVLGILGEVRDYIVSEVLPPLAFFLR
jgi:hypothetical protein